MQGRRVYLERDQMHKLEPGDYARASDGMFWMKTPNGIVGRLNPAIHSITEHEDGTITVSPSILCKMNIEGRTWHGWLEKGIWRE